MVLDMMRVWGLGLLIIAAIIFVTWLADPALPQTAQPFTHNFSKVIDKGGTFQTVIVPAKNFLRHSILIQNNNSLLHNCWIYVGEGTPAKALSYLLLPGRSYERSAPFAPINAVSATCDYDKDTLYIEAQ
ncbi:MAG TPA: hypothetical protein VLJ17_24820 [Xanthobacteraceae bacterium]|nr:hypothetical protein [Xanthobacteraceae bacterium]